MFALLENWVRDQRQRAMDDRRADEAVHQQVRAALLRGLPSGGHDPRLRLRLRRKACSRVRACAGAGAGAGDTVH